MMQQSLAGRFTGDVIPSQPIDVAFVPSLAREWAFNCM